MNAMFYMRPVVAQGRKVYYATGCDSKKWNIYLNVCVEAKHGVELRHVIARLEFLAESGKWSVLILCRLTSGVGCGNLVLREKCSAVYSVKLILNFFLRFAIYILCIYTTVYLYWCPNLSYLGFDASVQK